MTSHVLSTDTSAPRTSMRWYLQASPEQRHRSVFVLEEDQRMMHQMVSTAPKGVRVDAALSGKVVGKEGDTKAADV